MLRRVIAGLHSASEKRRMEPRLLIVGATWRGPGRVVIASIEILEGLVVEAAVAALKACLHLDADPIVTSLASSGTVLVSAAVDDSLAVATSVIATAMTDSMRDVDEWPGRGQVALVDIGDAPFLSSEV